MTTDVLQPRRVRDETEAFFRALRASRLLPDEELAVVQAQLQPGELSALQDLLVSEGILTPYQLNRVCRGEHRGLMLGSYRILDELGRGGCGCVYKAVHSVMDRTVALKAIAPEFAKESETRQMFRREVAATTRLRHPNIALTYDANETDGVLYLALEYVEGPTLQKLVADEGPLGPALACAILLQTAQALQHAHENGLVHRDIKPANIMLPGLHAPNDPGSDSTPLVKVVDFGLARLYPRDERRVTTILCESDATLGTPAFISPEQIRDFHGADIRSDIYSLGCTFYYALSGFLPFDGASSQTTLVMHLEREPVSLKSRDPSIPAPLANIIQRMMAKSPADRYQTPQELINAVNAFVLTGGLGSDVTENGSAKLQDHPKKPEPPRKSSPALLQAEPTRDEAVATLRRLWSEWCDVVEARIAGRPAMIADDEYKSLYKSALRAIAASAGAELGDGLLAQLQNTLEPWVTLKSLDNLDPAIGRSLAHRSRVLEAALRPVEAPRQRSWLPVAVVFGLLVLVGGAILWASPSWLPFRVPLAAIRDIPTHRVMGTMLFVPALLMLFALIRRKERA